MASIRKPTAEEDSSLTHATAGPREFDLEQVVIAVRGIRFGEVQVIIQDGTVVPD